MIREFQQRGTSFTASYSSRGTMLVAGDSLSVEQKTSDGAEFQRRQRDSASRILNAQQLEVFTQTQEDMMSAMRQGWEHPPDSSP